MNSELWCPLCNLQLNSEAQFKSHEVGQSHRRRRVKPEDLYCDVCNMLCNSLKQLEEHKNGRSHIVMLNAE